MSRNPYEQSSHPTQYTCFMILAIMDFLFLFSVAESIPKDTGSDKIKLLEEQECFTLEHGDTTL